jgi:hypothetical protein
MDRESLAVEDSGDNRIGVWDMQEVLAHPAITEPPATYAIGE